MLVAVCADKGSPGATTTALVLGSVWPDPATVVEADPYGGDLAIRLRTRGGAALPEVPTVLTLAAAARTSSSPELVNRYAHPVTEALSVVPGHLAAEQVAGVSDWEPLAAALRGSRTPVVVDVGRAHGSSPVLPLVAAADLVLVVGRPDPGSVIHLRERCRRLVPALAALRNAPPRLMPVLVSTPRHGPADAADVGRLLADTPAGPMIVDVGQLAFDPAAVGRLQLGESPAGRLARTPLLRTARVLAEQVATAVAAAQPKAAASAGVAGEAEVRR